MLKEEEMIWLQKNEFTEFAHTDAGDEFFRKTEGSFLVTLFFWNHEENLKQKWSCSVSDGIELSYVFAEDGMHAYAAALDEAEQSLDETKKKIKALREEVKS